MNNHAVEKINKIGKAGSILVLIMKIFIVIGFVVCLAGFIATLVLPEDFVKVSLKGQANITVDLSSFNIALPAEEVEQSITNDVQTNGYLTIGGASIELNDVSVTDRAISLSGDGTFMDFSLRKCAYLLFVAMMTLMMTFVTLLFAGFLTKSFANCQSPFDQDVIRKMKNFAYSLIPWTVISGIGNAISSNIFFGGNTNFNLTVNLSYVFIVLIILGLAYIFQYGAELQRESDETL